MAKALLKVDFMRKGIGMVAIVVMAALVALACTGEPSFIVSIDDGRPLREWWADDLRDVEASHDVTSLNAVVNISLQCKQYESANYRHIKACRSVPDNASVWDVEVRGNSGRQSFDFAVSESIVFTWDSGTIDLVERTTSNHVLGGVFEMIVTLR